MAIVLDTQKAMREIQKLPFCYLCGRKIDAGDKRNRDHVPPNAIFAIEDRDFPLILPTHQACNDGWSGDDEAIGHLVGLLHGCALDLARTRLRISGARCDCGFSGFFLAGLDLRSIIRRCIRGFHAALYREGLEESAMFSTCPPLPEVGPTGEDVQRGEVPKVVPKFVEELKRNRATGTLDRIVCRNGKCKYECVWIPASDGRPICIYGFDLYRWKRLGDHTPFKARGCVGAYRPPEARVPAGATHATGLAFPVENIAKLDPFGD